MDKKTRQKIFAKRELIRYSANRAYFGKLTGAGLANAYGVFKHTQDWDAPITRVDVTVGKIDGVAICHALWYEMSYNPARFGKVSPFLHNGKESAYRFCDKPVSQDIPGFSVLEKLRSKMIQFMDLNKLPNGAWNADIKDTDGKICISYEDGHSDNNYKKLSLLQQMIRLVISQNLEDFNRKQYRVQMLNVIAKRHPNGVRDSDIVTPKSPEKSTINFEDYMEEDRIDRAIESAQITLDNEKYVPQSQFEQAQDDIKAIRNMKKNGIIR